MQRYTVYFIWKLVYMLRMVLSPIIRSTNNYIYSVCYLLHRYVVRYPQHTQTSSNSSTIAADSSDGVTNNRRCRYRCMRSWWWEKYHPKHVEQFPDKINCVTLHLVGYILEYYYNARTHKRQKKCVLTNLSRAVLHFNCICWMPLFILGF
jgi:hypothetical protein